MTGTGNTSLSVHDLLALARDKSKASRSKLVAAINDLYSGENRILTGKDRAIMFDILKRLIHEVEASVRERLAQHLADQTDVPRELMLALANDKIEIAYPVLVKSALLRDKELIEIVQLRAMEHQAAIAMRARISEPVSDALVDTGNVQVISTLLSNDGARIREDTMGRLVEAAGRTERYQQPLAFRRDLPPPLVRKLYSGVSAALRAHLVANFNIDPEAFDEIAEATIHEALTGDAPLEPDPAGRADADGAASSLPWHDLTRVLQNGEMFEFLNRFTKLSGLRVTLVRRFLFEPGGEGLAITCKAIGLEKHDFAFIFVRFRQGRVGDKQVEDDELTRALSFFDRFTADVARTVLERWRMDTEYLNAIRLIDQAAKG